MCWWDVVVGVMVDVVDVVDVLVGCCGECDGGIEG